jgi:hypothetical protein
MSEKMTLIRVPGQQSGLGLMLYGEETAEKAIADYRALGARHRAQAEIIENAADEDFQIDVVRGVHVQHHVRTVQQSALAKARGEA